VVVQPRKKMPEDLRKARLHTNAARRHLDALAANSEFTLALTNTREAITKGALWLDEYTEIVMEGGLEDE
jgi:hypothetical protein